MMIYLALMPKNWSRKLLTKGKQSFVKGINYTLFVQIFKRYQEVVERNQTQKKSTETGKDNVRGEVLTASVDMVSYYTALY